MEKPCERLWAAVLEQAVKDLEQNRPSARTWFHSKKQGVGSFLWVCEVLGLVPEAIRTRVLSKKNGGGVTFVQRFRFERSLALLDYRI